jgi:tRNA 2-thiouridine synthesizing protein A
LEKQSADEIERTIKLLADLESLRGRRCKRCDAAICNHEALFSISMGFKNAPLCCGCLAAEFEREPINLRDELWSTLLHRPCHRAGWAWANKEEGYDPGEFPGCLWPETRAEKNQIVGGALEETLKIDAHENDAWDAGSLGCGDLVLELRIRLRAMQAHQILKVTANDPGAPEDLPAWCRMTGHTLVRAAHPQYWIRRKED